MPSRPTPDKAPAFREAIAQWQLAARTAVKQSSSLPSGVFDACDPMLEARLAESVQQLMEQLQKPTGFDQGDAPERRRETVTAEELAQLRRRAGGGGGDDERIELTSGQMAELLGVLLDTAITAPSPARATALEVLRDEFGISEQYDLDAAAAELADHLCRNDGANRAEALDDDVAAKVAALCGRIAGAALVQSRPPAAPEDGG